MPRQAVAVLYGAGLCGATDLSVGSERIQDYNANTVAGFGTRGATAASRN